MIAEGIPYRSLRVRNNLKLFNYFNLLMYVCVCIAWSKSDNGKYITTWNPSFTDNLYLFGEIMVPIIMAVNVVITTRLRLLIMPSLGLDHA